MQQHSGHLQPISALGDGKVGVGVLETEGLLGQRFLVFSGFLVEKLVRKGERALVFAFVW